MAHVGKLYKLHRRRDLCLNCNPHRYAWAEAYQISASFYVAETNGPQTFFVDKIARRYPFDDLDSLKWRTDAFTFRARLCHARAEFIGYDFENQYSNIVMELWDSTHKVASCKPSQGFDRGCSIYRFGGSFGSDWTIHDVAWWGGAHVSGNCTVAYAPWSVYNPPSLP